ncbi:Cell division control protein/predicted DNA repair exonuclease [Balamuthia mandrillaris]
MNHRGKGSAGSGSSALMLPSVIDDDDDGVDTVDLITPAAAERSSRRKKKRWENLWEQAEPFLPQLSRVTWVLMLVWALTLFWCEFYAFRSSVAACAWPDATAFNFKTDSELVRTVLVADPQLTDKYSYKFVKEPFLGVLQHYSDIYMRRGFQAIQDLLRPSHVFFLGDLFDSAKRITKEEYHEEMLRYEWVFEVTQPVMRVYTIPGNHDIGYKIPRVPELVQQYVANFGPLNQKVNVGAFEFILISAPSYDDSTDPVAYQQTRDFVESLSVEHNQQHKPRILLTHVPLWRDTAQQSCGPERRKQTPIREGKGHSYTNLLSRQSSETILRAIQPVAIFSGDDHDHCVVYHPVPSSSSSPSVSKQQMAPERTLGTFSWLQGNPWPSFGLMSIFLRESKLPQQEGRGTTTKREPVVLVNICQLPNQLSIYGWYLILAVLSVVLPLFYHFTCDSCQRLVSIQQPSSSHSRHQESVLPLVLCPTSSSSSSATLLNSNNNNLTKKRSKRNAVLKEFAFLLCSGLSLHLFFTWLIA